MKYIFFLFLYMISFSFVNAQTTISNKKDLLKIEEFANTNIDSLFFYAKKSQKSSNLCTKNLGIISEANVFYKRGDFEKSEVICLKVIKHLKEVNTSCNYKILLSAYNRLFWIKKNQAQYNKAFQYILEKKKVIETIPERNMYYYLHKLSANNNIASIKEILGLHNDALNILKETNKELQKLIDDNTYHYNHLRVLHASNLNMIGNNFFILGKDSITSYLDSAAVYYQKAYRISQSFVPLHKNSKQLYTLRKVKVLTQKKKFNLALKELATINSKELNFKLAQNIAFYKAIIYYNLSEHDSTLVYANTFLYDSKNKPNTKENKIVIYDILANQYNTLKKADSAYKYSNLGLKELSKLTSDKNKINRFHYNYNFNQIKKKNALAVKTKYKTHVSQLLFIGITSFLLLIFLIYKSKLKRIKNKEQFDERLDEVLTKNTPPKKDYHIEKELENTILAKLEALENSTAFLKSDFNIKVLAKKLETNTSYLSYIINNTKKQSFKQYITKLRIAYLIKKLNSDLQYQNYTIQYLAEEIGYTNASAFTRAFKKELGITPSEYIKSLKK